MTAGMMVVDQIFSRPKSKSGSRYGSWAISSGHSRSISGSNWDRTRSESDSASGTKSVSGSPRGEEEGPPSIEYE